MFPHYHEPAPQMTDEREKMCIYAQMKNHFSTSVVFKKWIFTLKNICHRLDRGIITCWVMDQCSVEQKEFFSISPADCCRVKVSWSPNTPSSARTRARGTDTYELPSLHKVNRGQMQTVQCLQNNLLSCNSLSPRPVCLTPPISAHYRENSK